MKIGIFDSGVGGQSFIEPVQRRFPDAQIIYKDDHENVPYGNKTPQQLFELSLPIFRSFEQENCDVVLVACNTLTTNAITLLRGALQIPLVGVEPMIRSAAEQTTTRTIVMCATPGTLASERYKYLKQNFAPDCHVIEPDCSDWSSMIENNRQDELELKNIVDDAVANNADILVLGCTHYHWIYDELQELAGSKMKVINPIRPVIDQLERVISEL